MFRIGKYSLIAQVSGRLLRYYDEIGLLRPEHADRQTGYRYYSAGQLLPPQSHSRLEGAWMGLDQIARLLGRDTSSEAIRGLLPLRKAQITQAMQDYLVRLQLVEARLDQMDAYGKTPVPDVVVKAIAPQRYLALRAVFAYVAAVRRLVERVAGIVPTILPSSSLGQVALVIHSPMFDSDALDFEVGYLLNGNTGRAPATVHVSQERVLTVRDLPAVKTMATLAHAGRIRDTHRSYSLLDAWVEQQQWHLVGQGRQVLMQLLQPDHDDAVIELQLPVSEAGTPQTPREL
jgi:DNA-binding transcriptional MerR regulator